MRYQVIIQDNQSILQSKNWYNIKWRTVDESLEYEPVYTFQERCRKKYKQKVILLNNKK